MKNKLTVIFLLFSYFLSAQKVDYVIEKFSSDITLLEDGKLEITETIDVDFRKKRRGIIRNIPERYTFEGKNVRMQVSNVSVDGHQYKVSEKGRDKVIRIGNPSKYITGKQQYKIRYTAAYPIINHNNYQELYWNVTGLEWDAEILAADLTIHLPKDLALSTDDMLLWTGKRKSEAKAGAFNQIDTKTVTAATSATLARNENMTIAMKMPSDYLNIPEGSEVISKEEEDPVRKSNARFGWLAIPLGLFGGLFAWWSKVRAREIKPTYNKLYEAYPPEGLTSAHVGGFIDHGVQQRDVMSLIPYWAAEGYLRMSEEDGMALYKRESLPSSFPEYELDLFDALFAEGDIVYIDKLDGRLLSAVQKACSKIDNEVKLQDYYDDLYLNIWKSKWTVVMGLVPIALGIVAIIGFQNIILGAGLIFVSLGILILSLMRPSMSPKGKNLMARLEALKRFLKDSPAEDLAAVVAEDPKYFDKLFPYAVAFGIDKRWLKSMQPHMENSPDWYTHSGGAGFHLFSDNYNTRSMSSSFTTTPQEVSSGGGFSSGGGGGGFSGGGFGGGGGSSW